MAIKGIVYDMERVEDVAVNGKVTISDALEALDGDYKNEAELLELMTFFDGDLVLVK